MPLRREEATRLVTEFERSQPVENFRLYGWHVWPLLRVLTAYEACQPSRASGEASSPPPARWYQALRRMKAKVTKPWDIRRQYRQFQEVFDQDPRANVDPDAIGMGVVILTLSGRRVPRDGKLYEIYTDPLIDRLSTYDISSLVWEHGEERWPRHRPSAWITRRLEWELKTLPELPRQTEPAWHDEFAALAERLLGHRPSWTETEDRIRRVEQMSRIFERWLRRTGARLFMAVCWYDPLVMAATLAARRLGLLTVELQHGLQDSGHFAYAGWLCSPPAGYEVVPDYFWQWGVESAQRLEDDNPALHGTSSAIVGGNPWFNLCRNEPQQTLPMTADDGEFAAGRRKRILVALQKGIDFSQTVLEAVRQSPADWLWLIRQHPGTTEAERAFIRKRFLSSGCPGIEIDHTNVLPLFTLLKTADVLVTGFSTCVIEGLGFGIPAVLVHPSGKSSFARYIDAGVVFYAESGIQLLQRLNDCESVASDVCRRAAEGQTASETATASALNLLLVASGLKGDGCR